MNARNADNTSNNKMGQPKPKPEQESESEQEDNLKVAPIIS